MRGFAVIGDDPTTGQAATMNVSAGSVGEAVEFGRARGLDVHQVRSFAGNVYQVTADGITKGESVPAHGGQSQLGMYLIATLIPVVGLIAGCVRIGVGKPGGTGLIGASVLGVFVWALVLAAGGGV